MRSVSPKELQSMMRDKVAFQLIDVREREENSNFNIGGLLIPLQSLIDNIDLVEKNISVIFYCKVGIRSAIAIQRLEQKFGLTNLLNLSGGIEKWKQDVEQT